MKDKQIVDRRTFLGSTAAGAAWSLGQGVLPVSARAQATAEAATSASEVPVPKPNLVFVFADQWRADALGYTGNPDVQTPNLDKLAADSLNFTHAVSGCPVCSPYRGSLLTGQHWLTHGVFLNDVHLRDDAVSFAEALKAGGYDTGYIGKWHLDGRGRLNYIPRESRQGFDFWRVMECTHNYNESYYYADEPEMLLWQGYDAFAQTREAQRYIEQHGQDKPFALFLSLGPPHAPYGTAPELYRAMYEPSALTLRANVPEELEDTARDEIAGYYAHCTALDTCMGYLRNTLKSAGLEDNTVFVFTSDHGDMLRSQGEIKKQRPWDESIRVPFLLRYPARLGAEGRKLDTLLNTPDLMPTLLGLCGVDIPATVEGQDYSGALLAGETPETDCAFIMCPAPFGQWTRKMGGREFRGVRTKRYTYTRDLNGPWLLYDNEADPMQLNNLVNDPAHEAVQTELEGLLQRKLAETKDDFLPADAYIAQWGYTVDKDGTVPYTN